ncbi:recombinase family protein [Pseudonocardia alni]|uniref:DNA invertase Pin-like site-specific DNA recombinase n=1 Tax=Pseudonocardia alni TaxID=33907 RepID=A0A852W1T6_PSEA5|nr:recombinase family protein [Pseudonocardia antarctica]NYG00375.1 DNA invertase Pin-like site-specific DNA recombinase [Pseudonocardia antarctica]
MTERAGVYARISEDPRATELGVTRQRDDALALVGLRGWQHVGTWQDNDIAVLSGDAHRPGYAAMMAAVERGEVTRIVAYGLSRLWRNRRERAEAIETLRRHRVSVSLVKGSDLDLTSAAGRGVAGLMGEFDTMESELKAERVARAAQQRAEQGKASGHVLYGWRRERTRNASGEVVDWRDVEEPQQAAVVREIVDRLLAGHSLRAITASLNDRGLLPPRAALRQATGHDADAAPQRWIPSTVRKLAVRPANIARVRRGGNDDFGPASWPALVDEGRHERVCALLTDPGRRDRGQDRGPERPGARRYLLTYSAVGSCGGCGAHLRVITRAGNLLYACTADRGCVARRMEWVDQLVEAVVVRRLQEPDALRLLTRDDAAARAARERVAEIRAKLDRVADRYADDEITDAQLSRITARLRPQLVEAERDASRAVRGVDPALVAGMAGEHAQSQWNALTEVSQRWALLEAMGVRVRLLTGMPGGPGFRPESVDVSFVDPAAEQAAAQ